MEIKEAIMNWHTSEWERVTVHNWPLPSSLTDMLATLITAFSNM